MSRTCGVQGRDEKCIEKIWVSEPEGRDYLQYLDIDGRMILNISP